MRHFGCPVTILNTLDPLGKFDGKADEGFLVGYSVNRNQPNHNAGIKENLDAGKVRQETVSAQQYVLLPLWSIGSQDPSNIDDDTAFDVKDIENEVHVYPSSSDKPKKHDENAKREAKGKSHVDLSTGVRDLRDEFKEFSVNSTNRVNAASAPVIVVGPNPTNSTNNMPAFEDIVYSDDEEDVGAEANFSNLKHIYISSNKQYGKDGKRTSLCFLYGFMVYQMDVKSIFPYGTIEEEVYVCQPPGFEDPDDPDKVYKVVKALYGLHQAPRAWHETLANYLLENDGKSASTPIDIEKPLLKDPDSEDVDTVVATSSTEAEYVAVVLKYYGFKRTILDCVFLGFGLTMQVKKSSIE
nr:putative ribonuclease H-like domain-containing protein [Tanacetum cinerariifolium]